MIKDALMLTNRRAAAQGLPILYANDEPWLNSEGDNTVAFQISVNSSNLFSLLNNPSEASTISVYKSWFEAPPDLSISWSIVNNDITKPCQFMKYESRAGVFIVFFKHGN